MEILGYISALFIGLLLGLIGGGGSILTVPVLVYLMHINPVLATTYSLFIVGVTSMTGGVRAFTKKLVDFKAVSEFGIPSILAIFIARHYLLPAIPEKLFSIGNFEITKDILLMVVFAILMLGASWSIIRNQDEEGEYYYKETGREEKTGPVMFLGFAVGLITGFLGAGGGFLIIPALVLFMKIPMKTAIGSSLLIIGINSLFGFLFSLKQTELDWKLLFLFTALAIVGINIGHRLGEKIHPAHLKKIFGWFVLVMGVYIIARELFF